MDIRSTFNSLKGTGLQRDTFHENMSWDDYVAELSKLSKDDNKLKELIYMKSTEERIDETTLEKIMSSNFMAAKEIIDQMTLEKRIQILEDVHAYRDHLYQSVSIFGMEGIPRDEQLSATDFRILLGRIKHLEILMNWLYGIV